MTCKLHNTTTAWILDYLLSRPKFVRLDRKNSDTILTKTGAPQGTVLSPFLYSLDTTNYRQEQVSCNIHMFSDDTGLAGLLTWGNDLTYKWEVESFVGWCSENFLKLNVSQQVGYWFDEKEGGGLPSDNSGSTDFSCFSSGDLGSFPQNSALAGGSALLRMTKTGSISWSESLILWLAFSQTH